MVCLEGRLDGTECVWTYSCRRDDVGVVPVNMVLPYSVGYKT